MFYGLIERPIAVTMSLIAVLVLGILATTLTPVSLMPNIAIPQITVQVTSTLSARELEESVVKVLRNQLMQVPNLEEITSETRDGIGLVKMQFSHGADIDYSFIEVNERIDRSMGNLPRSVERPKVIKASATDIPAFYINVTLKDSLVKGRQDPLYPVPMRFVELSDFVRSVVAKRIEQLTEVAMVDMSGLVYPEILILPDNKKFEALGVTESVLSRALWDNNIELGNLTIRDGEYYYNVRFRSNVESREEIEQIYLNINNRVFQFKELAQVVEHPRPREGMVVSDGKAAISMAVIKQSEAKMADMRKSISKLLALFDKDYPDLRFTMTRDQTALLEYSIKNLSNNIWIGAILACLVLFLFMRDLRTPFLITITIPLALVITLLFFYLLNISINIISLSGLVLGIGMMTDNSIITIDNISQWWDRGHGLRDSTVKATREVFAPMFSSVLTTCAVFVPLIFLSGVAGALFYDQAMAISISLLTSLAVSVLVIPVYYYLMFRKKQNREVSTLLNRLSRFDYIHYYEKGLKWVFRHQRFVFSLFFGSILLTGIAFDLMEKEKLPKTSQTDILLKIDWNRRYLLSENEKNILALMSEAGPGIVHYTAMVGVQQYILSHTPQLSTSESLLYLQANSADELIRIQERIMKWLKREHPQSVSHFSPSGNIFDMIFSENQSPLMVHIYTSDGQIPKPDRLNRLLASFSDHFKDIYIEPVAWQEHLLLTTNPLLMATYRVNYNTIYEKLSSALSQNQLFTLTAGGFSIPIVMGGDPTDLSSILSETRLFADSSYIPLSRFVVETRGRDFKNITAGIEGTYYPLPMDVKSNQIKSAIWDIDRMIKEYPEFEANFTGSWFSNKTLMWELFIILIVALLLLVFILSAQFESLVQPLIIISEIVFDICGALLLLWVCGVSINLMSMIGIVVMVAIVINDSILKVDTMNRLRREGYGLLHAVMLGGLRRVKPIIMTSLTTILAVCPMLFTSDMGSQLQYPLALAVISGMFVGTMASIFFVPLLYYRIYVKR